MFTSNRFAIGSPRVGDQPCPCRERGQTTAEYALVLLAAGTIAMLVIAWAQDTGSIGALFDAILERITSLVN